MSVISEFRAIPGPAGRIELQFGLPEGQALALAIICHPHPLFGGTMQNKVVTTLERAFRERNAVTLRFNFRGVGQSTGDFAQGVGESEDLLAVHAFARQHFPTLPLWLSGFSFGSYVAARVASTLQPQRLLSIAPPVVSWDFRALDAITCPWLIVQGDADEVVDANSVYAFAGETLATLEVLPSSHFFHGKLLELRAAVQSWIDK